MNPEFIIIDPRPLEAFKDNGSHRDRQLFMDEYSSSRSRFTW
jgi:hypothetical protein